MNTNINRSLKTPPPRRTPHRTRHGELGITLQTLIITAVVVVIAIGVGLLFIALTSSSSEDLEDAGRTGQDAACAPNELLDAVFVREGFGGPSGRGGVRSKAVGCKPYCATWEFVATPSAGGEYRPGGTGEGSPIGGPEGLGGVFSSNVGCFAPCYWQVGMPRSAPVRPRDLIGIDVKVSGDPGQHGAYNPDSRLRYYSDNRLPARGEIRLGVTHKRLLDKELLDTSYPNYANYDTLLGSVISTDLQPSYNPQRSRWDNRDGKPYIYGAGGTTQRWAHGMGVQNAPATPLTPEQIANGIPTVHIPNWQSAILPSHASLQGDWGYFNTQWEDEHWEIRADPESEVCEIVYTPTDRLICSSANSNCLESNRANSDCPATYNGDPHPFASIPPIPVCRLP